MATKVEDMVGQRCGYVTQAVGRAVGCEGTITALTVRRDGDRSRGWATILGDDGRTVERWIDECYACDEG